jgi:hypothetical protein
MLLCGVLGFVLAGVRATKALNRFRLGFDRSILVAALGTEHFPKPLVITVGDPASVCVMTPAEAQPTSVWEMMVLAWRRISRDRRGIKCSVANPAKSPPPTTT